MNLKELIKNKISLIIALIGFLGGFFWAYESNWDYEPLILVTISAFEIIGYFLTSEIKTDKADTPVQVKTKKLNTNNSQTVKIVINGEENQSHGVKINSLKLADRNALIESKKSKVNILFIDDDTKFNVVKILKDSGWKNTKTVVDVKSIDTPVIQSADILFVDINGVGKLLGLEYGGLDLALMIKQKYMEKKVIIYSANKNSNSFHKVWDIVDSRLEKNALPYQFQNLVDNYSLELYN